MQENATFYYFKRSGKYYAEGRGVLPETAFGCKIANQIERRQELLRVNNNKMPGLTTTASEFFVVVIGDETVDYGWPLHLDPVE